ncbi:transcriptional elongation regulator MINIYO-like [Actinidia eriantha]|uniref:transcriptional elongation regulator MINIYO-like n=1 Tax=Actinidia eriantha TaxID=165200 RepID=UPI00258B49FF|nr:transcriptional elongation regulator MINIYO-like [Actinidia eriantha]
MEKARSGRNMAAKTSQRKPSGAKSLQVSEDEASRLVGGIVEKGISDAPLPPSSAPRFTVLPFPVARHRSHGPHWAPTGRENSGRGGGVDEEDAVDEDLTKFDSIVAFANPVQRKEKKGMDFSQWRELMASDNSSLSQKKKEDKYVIEKSKGQKKANGVAEISDKKGSRIGPKSCVLPQKLLPDNNAKAQDVTMEEMDSESLEEVTQSTIVEKREGTMEESVLLEVSKRQRQLDTQKHNMGYNPNNLKNEDESTGIESQIDAENRAQLQRMSANEIAEAQAEIMERMTPAVMEALRKRGQNKLKKQKESSSVMAAKGEVGNLHDGKQLIKYAKGSPSNSDISENVTTATSIDTRSGLGCAGMQNLRPGSSSLWDSWSERVETVKELRFSLDGNVVSNDFEQVTMTGNTSTRCGYTADNVSERDFLRTEGDPAAAGYTIKEAVALTRSVVPGQRALAMHLLASVLDKALHNICQNQVGYNVKVGNDNRFSDWGAVWAYALGPEPELVLSLRMSLDDNHNSVVIACARVIHCTLSCDANESYFHISEKISTYPKDLCTAPSFRSRPEIDVGFLHGGFWKYNAKPSNILPFGEDIVSDKAEDEHTIQDDIVVAGQDFVAGLVRMGILERIHYLLETDPSAVLEECVISILVAIARHSPTCADAIMKCQRLVQTVVDRFSTKELMEANPSKIKSVTLLRVLARSEKKNCIDFIKNGIFQNATWHLYQYAFSRDRWINLGKENCKLSSALIVEQLRLWKVCIQYGYCVTYFSDFFPALCMWLNVPTFEELIENNVLIEFTAITEEAFLVLGALTSRLSNFYSHTHVSNKISEVAAEDMETWSWVHVSPVVDLAMKWIALRSNPCMSKFFEWQQGDECSSVINYSLTSSLLWVISAVLHMLYGVLDKVIPEDAISLAGGHVPWLPEFVPKIGLEIINNGFLSFPWTNATEHGGSFAEYLCHLRHQGENETSIASVCCLHGLVKVVDSVDKLIQLPKSQIHTSSSNGHSTSREGLILAAGIVKSSILEFTNVLTIFMNLITSQWQWTQSIEMFGRGGPAPGVGVGWGAVGGGFWSKDVLLAQTDAGLLISLVEIFQIVSAKDLPSGEDVNFTMQRISSVLGVCLIVGPRDGFIMDKALEMLLQVPVLKYFDLCIHHFITIKGLKPLAWAYKEEDYQLFSKTLASHFRNRWLAVKNKLKAVDGSRCVGEKMSKKGGDLDTIHEDLDTSDMTSQDHSCTSLDVEWAHQRLPLPMHWFLSPISTINGGKRADLPSASNITNRLQDLPDFLEVAKGGLFFLLGIEAMSSFTSSEIQSPVRSVPLTWKLHSLSIILLSGVGVLEEQKSRDVYETLQVVYAKLVDVLRLSRSKEFILEDNERFLADTGVNYGMEFLNFQSEIHESYSTFLETLVEQFAAVSYGDLIYGRQVALYLHRCVETSVRLAAWTALSNAHVLELLPPLENCVAKAEGFLEPVEVNEKILEAYVKSWVSGALDRAVARGSVAFTLVLHHLSSFIFCCSTDDKLSLRNKLAKSLLRDYSRKQQHEGMMLDFIQYQKPEQREGSSVPKDEVEKRFKLLIEACEGNASLLRDVEKLRLSFQRKTPSC